MKTLLALVTTVSILALSFVTPMLQSCTKEKLVHDTVTVTLHDTTIVEQHDTTVIYKHDTIQRTLQLCYSSRESSLNSYYPMENGNGAIELAVGAWTHSGSPEITRSFLEFDYSDVPAGANIISAQLYLYAIPAPTAGNYTEAHSGPANACYVRRITADWPISSINWSTQPVHTAQNQVTLPQTTSAFQNDTIDVKVLVDDMLSTHNYGFAIILKNEAVYNIRQYCSSFYSDEQKRPKLVIQYKKQ